MNTSFQSNVELLGIESLRHQGQPAEFSRESFATPHQGTFTNPIVPAPSADPWVVQHNGLYYYAESRNQKTLHIRVARSLEDLGYDEGVCIWKAPGHGANSNAVWAPELHLLNGKWYIYYAADDGLNENHRMWVLESVTDDPQGEYVCRGCMDTEGWAIDGTILTMEDGSNYFVWSGWPGNVNGKQNIYIAPMSNPWTLSAPRQLLATPTESWETVEMAICEGPQILQRNGKTFIIYSASGSWTEDYCLGMLTFKGGDVCDRANWEKTGPVFQKTDWVWGLGHCSFTQSLDGTEDWIVFHCKTKRSAGWIDRNVHAQPFTWTDAGLPHFGTPIAAGEFLRRPGQPAVAARQRELMTA